MKKIAVDLGVKEDDTFLEDSSKSTYENLLNSQKIMNDHHLNSSIIVTEPFHIARTELVARKLGYTFTVSPSSQSPCWIPWKYATKYFIKEPIAILSYKLGNKI